MDTKIKWLTAPEDQDYPAAESYLNLIFDSQAAENFSQQLKKVPMSSFKAKDIFRASGLSLLGVINSHIEKVRKKILSR